MESLDDLYCDYARPYLGRLLKLLKLDLNYISGKGDVLTYRDAEKNHELISVLDLLGGYGSTLLGHSHPEMIAALEEQLKMKSPVHAQMSLPGNATRLTQNLSELLQAETGSPDTWITNLCNSSDEASIASMKHALLEWKAKQEARIFEIRKLRSSILHREPNSPEIAKLEYLLKKVESTEPVIFVVRGKVHAQTAGSEALSENPALLGTVSGAPCAVEFLDPNQDANLLHLLFEAFDYFKEAGRLWSRVIGVIYEPIQAEGGIQILSADFAKSLASLAGERTIPLIADEIQCGLYRTGNLLASTALQLKPNYVLFGKGLGGAVSKLASFSVRASSYQVQFEFVLSSSFAEDEPSCAVALRCLKFLKEHASDIHRRANHFEVSVKARLKSIQEKYPGVIQNIRGRGFMIGIEFNFSEEAPMSRFLSSIYQAGFATYIFTSYLLHHHRVRVGVTLEQKDTLRLEPSAWIDEESIQQAVQAIEALAELLFKRQYVKLTSHFWRQTFTPEQLALESPRQTPLKLSVMRTKKIKKVGFFTHLIDDEKFQTLDPLIRVLNRSERERFQEKFGPITGAFNYHEQIIHGKNNEETLLVCYGLFLPSSYFEKSLRAGDGAAFRQVEAATKRAASDGMDLVGLGQYTSIVTENGCLVDQLGVSLTTGNSLTAGFACQALTNSMRERGKLLANAHVGVVGAAGNICNVITQVLADQVGKLTLVFREDPKSDPKAMRAIQNIIQNSKIDPAKIRATSDISELADCDAIVMGTNTAKQILFPEHCKQDAVVLDISVPSNIDVRILKERPDVQCFQGGMAKLPGDQFIESVWVPSPRGEVFACMGEAIAAGLAGFPGHVSVGPLSKARVLEITQMAERVGLEVGSLRRMIAP